MTISWTSRENNVKLFIIKLFYIQFIICVLDDEKEQDDDVMPEEHSDQESGDDGSDGADDGSDGANDGSDGANDGSDGASDDSGADDADDSGDDGSDGADDSGDDGSDDNDNPDDDGSDYGSPKKKKRKLRDAREGKTIFIRNLPFDASEEEIRSIFETFGDIAYCKIVVDSVTEHSRGSAFVKFEEKQSADDCLKKYGDENDASEGKMYLSFKLRHRSPDQLW